MSQIQIFVINLDRAPERLARITQTLNQFGLSFERIAAVDGGTLSENEKRRLNPTPRVGGLLSDGEIGCFASHLAAYRVIAARGIQRACVMEDDAAFDESVIAWLDRSLALPGDCHILKLEGIIRPKSWVLPIRKYAQRMIVFSEQVSFGTGAYIITLEGARRALLRLSKMGSVLDDALFRYWETGLHIYEVHPFPIRQEEFAKSYIYEGRRIASEERNKKTPARWLRKRLRKGIAVARILLFQLRHFGPRMLAKVPASQ
jgi:glycosyl transferase family 25